MVTSENKDVKVAFFMLMALISPNIVLISSKKTFILLAIVQFLILLYGFVDVEVALTMYLSYSLATLSLNFFKWFYLISFK
jgi:hypothetical protein